MCSSFRTAPCTKQKFERNTIFKSIFPSTDKNLLVRLSQSSCFKALYERSHEQLFSQSALQIAYYQQRVSKNACVGKYFQGLINFIRKTFPKLFVKALYKRSKEQLRSQRSMFLTFYQLKLAKKAMLKQIVSSTDKVYQ